MTGSIGFAPFGKDYTGNCGAAADSSKPCKGFLTPWVVNCQLIGPMHREIACLNFEGKLQAVAEEKDKVTQTLPFGPWKAEVSYGASRNNRAVGNPEPTGRVLVKPIGR